MLRKYRVRDYDFKLIFLLVAVTVIGILAIGSARPEYQNRQLLGFVMGFFIMIVLSFFDYSFFLRFHWGIYALNITFLLMVVAFGKIVNNAKRWLEIGGIQFQPSELTKIMLILFYSQYIMKHREKINSLNNIAAMIILLIPPLYLVYDQPDMSTTIVIAMIFCVVWYVGGLSYKYIFGVLAIVVPIAVVFFIMVLQPDQTLIKDYQQERILAWLEPEKYAKTIAYQQTNAIMAIGSGQLWGKGLNNTMISVKNGNFVSEPQTDFIFTIVGEELGFVGGCTVVILLFLITLECLNVARKAKDLAGTCIAAGMATLVGGQSFVNIAVATGLFPTTGVPLPFVSAGLTSLVSLYIGMGIVLNVRLQCVRKYNN
ncbi:MAG: rod shape-determining protein RodA [Lachnospiraceae bacterium]|jgi:rod shape determining protein RodA|nr:rod shape-determining protein RodA [Lachnospiraceae bacterium]